MILGLLGLVILACGGGPSEVIVQLTEQENSGQSGTARLTEKGDTTEVVVQVNPAPADQGPQPLHIHLGSCGPNLGRIKYTLNDVVDGKSTTLVQVSLKDIQGNYNVNLHKSSAEFRIYPACGNIPKD